MTSSSKAYFARPRTCSDLRIFGVGKRAMLYAPCQRRPPLAEMWKALPPLGRAPQLTNATAAELRPQQRGCHTEAARLNRVPDTRLTCNHNARAHDCLIME